MNADDAEDFTQSLGLISGGLWRQIAWADRQGIPAALGFPNTREWVGQRLGYQKLEPAERREAVAELTDEGMSQRKIADVIGVGQSTVDRDQKHDPNGSPEAEEPQVTELGTVQPDPDGSPEADAKPLTWAAAVERWPFMADIPAEDHKQALAAARQLATLDDRERPRREEAFRRWCASRGSHDNSAALISAAAKAAERAWGLIAEVPVAVTDLLTRWEDLPEADITEWAATTNDAVESLTQLANSLGQASKLRRVK
jgi:hypothetical protein